MLCVKICFNVQHAEVIHIILYILGATTGLVYLAFVSCTGHPALEETECPDDFVLLRLRLGWDVVFIQLLLFNSVDKLMLMFCFFCVYLCVCSAN